jgi:hypothetical protein
VKWWRLSFAYKRGRKSCFALNCKVSIAGHRSCLDDRLSADTDSQLQCEMPRWILHASAVSRWTFKVCILGSWDLIKMQTLNVHCEAVSCWELITVMSNAHIISRNDNGLKQRIAGGKPCCRPAMRSSLSPISSINRLNVVLSRKGDHGSYHGIAVA